MTMAVLPIAHLILIHGSKCTDQAYIQPWSQTLRSLSQQEQRLVQHNVMSPASEMRLRRHLQLGLKIKVAADCSMESDSS